MVPYTDTLDQMLANGIWKINGPVTISADNGAIYYDVTNTATIATDGAVKIANKFTDESGRPNLSVLQTLTIPLVNILGGKYNFTFNFVMDNGRGDPYATRIENTNQEEPTAADCYDMQGRKLSNSQIRKGVYIYRSNGTQGKKIYHHNK